ncbi:protein of unknown function [Ruminococcaceae bacterium BL-4]|nr:protein of unknown function [Ruminococcaceae bacterium BL-4]
MDYGVLCEAKWIYKNKIQKKFVLGDRTFDLLVAAISYNSCISRFKG